MDNIFYNRHYIRLDKYNNIVVGFSDAFQKPQPVDICINEKGGYQFRLYPGGEENPQIQNEYDIYLYKYIDGVIIAKSESEIQAEIDALPKSAAPDETLSDTDIIMLAIAELAERLDSIS